MLVYFATSSVEFSLSDGGTETDGVPLAAFSLMSDSVLLGRF